MRLSDDLQISVSVAMTEASRLGHEYAGVEHLLYALLHDDDILNLLEGLAVDIVDLKEELEIYFEEELDPIGEEAEARPTLGFRRTIASAAGYTESAGEDEVASHNVLVAILDEDDSYARYLLEAQGLTRLELVQFLSHGAPGSRHGSGSGSGSRRGRRPGSSGGPREFMGGEGEDALPDDALSAFTRDLTEAARAGRIDPIIGREKEIARTLHILRRRRKNNPIFVGDPGVGKTALAEGLAMRIAEGNVPERFKEVSVYQLDMGALLAGTRYRGDFEERIKAVLEILEPRDDALLFIDEIHSMIGAGAAGGSTLDASDLLKPALQAGTLRVIGATTWEEYRQYFERDRALARRFQKVEVLEPSVEETIEILEGLRSRYEAHHEITITKSALKTAAHLADRYMRDRRLPDKAIDLVDEAGAAAALAGRKRIIARDIETVAAAIAQIPPAQVEGDDKSRLASLEDRLKQVVFGQDQAVSQLVSAIKVSRAGLRDAQRPIGAFLLTGPTGVGKTELAKQLAAHMGVEFLRFDMSEYMERHSVSRLVGAPPGYVGFDRGGLLTEAVSQSPHAVLLLDEIEKAHPDVFNILLQIMDHGTLTDTNGKEADFRHVILLMTSNVGAREMARGGLGFGSEQAGDPAAADLAYERLFSPEFRNRLDSRLQFAGLSQKIMLLIVDKFIDELQTQLKPKKVKVKLSQAARRLLAEKGYDPAFGARPLARVIDEEIKRPLTESILFGDLENGGELMVGAKDKSIVLRTKAR